MLVPAALHDNGLDTIALCSSHVFVLPSSSQNPSSTADLVESIKAAGERVVRKWPLLAGIPVKTDKGTWAINVPNDLGTTSRTRALFTFTVDTSLSSKPYHLAANVPLQTPFSASSTRELPFPPVSLFFPSSACQTTSQHAKRQEPLLHLHVTVLADSICTGVIVPHLFDGTGLGLVVRALDAELHGREWDVPPIFEVNPLVAALDALGEDKDVEKEARAVKEKPGFYGCVQFGLAAIARLLMAVLWEKVWWKTELRWVLLKKGDVERLARRVKKEVERETDGMEYVSTSDVIWAFLIKSAHSKDTSSVDAVAASLVYNVRPLLTSFSAKSSSSFRLSLYPFNAAFNWAPSGEPVPLSTLASQPLSTFALSFRRGLTAHRSLPSLLSDWRSRDPKTLPVPFRDRPQPPSFLRWLFPRQHVTRHLISDQTGLGLADLRLPDKDGVDLPLHTFYMTGHSPVYPDHVATLQKSVEGDYTLFAAMRRERWACLMRAIEGLRDNDDGVYGGEQ